ncbi:uncharacterized protein C9orf43 homolog [Elephas maximus indicus]|uniref:uncharacterized protein C9orf43 homolog n=1 Tax=Elephas maximus indicus TaxID=99487 RepID=UPI002115E3D4|nr:uncharacterized protein C9orf43 homolog [Elephas maximus indicus]
MDLPDANQWDETTCASAVCPHPQCWAALRRIERGHPRLLGSPCKTPLDTEDKLPVLTIVNISDSLRPKRCAQRCLSGFTFAKTHSLLSRGSKFDSKFQGLKSMKGLPDKGLISSTNTPPKVSVLNLNETSPLCPQDVRNMAVIWIPEEPEKHKRSPAEKKPDVTNQDGREKRKKSAVENKSALGSLEKQGMGTQLGRQEMLVPPPSPVHLLKQLHTDSILSWDQIDMLPQDLLKDLLTDEGKIIPSSNMKIELAMMKKRRPLEKSRPESAISSKMFLSVHRLTLQKPGLRHPEHLRKLHNNLMSKASLSEAARSPGPKKQQQQKQQQQQRKVKTLTKKQEVKKKTKSDPGSQNTLHERKVIAVYDPVSGHSSLPDEESDTKQQEQMEIEGPTLKQLRVYQGHTARALFKDATEEPGMDHLEKYPDSFTRHSSTELVKTESTKEDIGTQVEFELESQTSSEEKTPRNLSASIDGTIWNPELKLLRILQATDDEDEENQPSRAQSEGSLRAQAEGISHPIQEQDA